MTLEEVISKDQLNGVLLRFWTRNDAIELAYEEGKKEGIRLANEKKESTNVKAKETKK